MKNKNIRMVQLPNFSTLSFCYKKYNIEIHFYLAHPKPEIWNMHQLL